MIHRRINEMELRPLAPDEVVPDMPCKPHAHLFFGPEDDGRREVGRSEREDAARAICMTCAVRLPCLQKAMAMQERFGVWGGMSEGERRQFRAWYQAEGYQHVPTGEHFLASLDAYYASKGKFSMVFGRYAPLDNAGNRAV
jgi:hypothetical protein